jgi:hypothetical protein
VKDDTPESVVEKWRFLYEEMKSEKEKLERKVWAVAELLENNGCDCECGCDGDHSDDCDRCFACAVNDAIMVVK